MSKDTMENILGNINFEVETENEWLEPLGFDRDTWKQILNYITTIQQENKQLKERIKKVEDYASKVGDRRNELYDIIDKAIEYIKEKIYQIEPKGTGINFNCEYDSEEDYIRGIKTKIRLETLKECLEILGDKE